MKGGVIYIIYSVLYVRHLMGVRWWYWCIKRYSFVMEMCMTESTVTLWVMEQLSVSCSK